MGNVLNRPPKSTMDRNNYIFEPTKITFTAAKGRDKTLPSITPRGIRTEDETSLTSGFGVACSDPIGLPPDGRSSETTDGISGVTCGPDAVTGLPEVSLMTP